MRIVTEIEELEKINIQRIENGMVVGKRTIAFADYVESLMNVQPIDNIVAHFVSRTEDIKDLFEHIESDSNLQTFLTAAFQSISSYALVNNPDYIQLIKTLLSRCGSTSVNPELREQLLKGFLTGLRNLPKDRVYADLTVTMIKRLLQESQQSIVANKVISEIVRMARESATPALKEWFDIGVKDMNVSWLEKEIDKRANEERDLAISEIPKRCVAFKKTSSAEFYAIEIPKAQFRVKFHNVAYDAVGHPRLVAIIEVKDRIFTGMSLFAIEDKGEVTLNTELFHYPYSNVYESGQVCWSGIGQYEIKTPNDISILPTTFLTGINNTHLQSNVRKLFDEHNDKPFEDAKLKPFGKKLKNEL